MSEQLQNDELARSFQADFQAKVRTADSVISPAPHDPLPPEALDALFQIAHFLSGYGAAVGYPSLTEIGRDLEVFFGGLQTGKIPLSLHAQRTAHDTFVGLKSLASALSSGGQVRLEEHEALLRQIVRVHRELRAAQGEHGGQVEVPRKKILVVDDEELSQALIGSALKNAGFDVVACTSAALALQYVEVEKPDLILLDVIMPDMDGFELLKRMRQGEGLLPVPVIFVTTKTQLNEKLLALKTGADDYITKPFLPEELVARVGARIERYENLKELAVRDPLTGLYNHRYFQERIGEEIRRYDRYRRTFALSILDLDRFKQINDSHGHLIGDLLLRGVARFMEEWLRASDIIARYGGDEFVVIFPETDAEAAVHALGKLREKIRGDFPKRHPRFAGMRVTFSAGVAECPRDGGERGILIEHADQALYRAKGDGRDRIYSWAT